MTQATDRRSFIKETLALPILGSLKAKEAFPSSAPPPEMKSTHRQVLAPFNYRNVTLDGGSLRRQFDEVCDAFLRIPNDDLLKGFRQRAGLPAPGVGLGGGYDEDRFHVFGQLLGGLSRMYAASGNPAYREKVDTLVREWGKCTGPDGYFYYTTHPNAPHYTYEKMVGGLVDAHVYADNREALPLLNRITDWAIKNLSREKVYSFNAGYGNTEWYTLSENLYRAYLATGNVKYRDFASFWEYPDYWNLYASKTDIFTPFGKDQVFACYHAYSHVNALSGAGAAYEVKGEGHYLETLKNAYDYLFENQTFATGGYGPDERLMPPAEIAPTLWRVKTHFETQCGSWAIFKLSKYLLRFTGDAKYGDWLERVLINGIGASIPMAANGAIFYNSDYSANGGKKLNQFRWVCCNGTRSMAVPDYHDLIYFQGADGLYVNLFAPSTVKWEQGGWGVTVVQRTCFPEEDQVELKVSVARPTFFGLKIRVPRWLAGPFSATLNDQPVSVNVDEQHWAVFQRKWRDGDRLSLTLPAKFWLCPLPASGAYPTAVMRGPVTLAFRSPGGDPRAKIAYDRIDDAFLPSPGEPLTFHLKSDPSVLVRPFYALKEGEAYYVYLHPDLEKWAGNWKCTFSEGWNSTNFYWASEKEGATAEHEFEGRGIRWCGFRFEDGGKAEVAIDGEIVAVVDQYGPAKLPLRPPAGPPMPFVWEHLALSPGKHKIMVKVLGDKNDASNGRRITISTFEPVEA
jgi:hypothetical protein